MAHTGIHLLLALLFCVVLCTCQSDGPIRDGSKLRELEQILEAVPVYPGMVEVDRSSSLSVDDVHASREYRSSDTFNDVKRFYREKLPQDGWQFVEDREVKDRGRIKRERLLEFRRGKYHIDIKYAGERVAELGWTYSVSVGWYD